MVADADIRWPGRGQCSGWTIDATYKGATRSNPSLWLEGVPNDALQIAVKGSIQDLAAIRPGAPQTFEVKQGDTRMTLSWAEPADAGSLVAAITKYQYRFSAGATVAGGAIWNDVPDSIDLDASTADETQVVVTGLSNGTLYAFEVRAVSSAGNGVAAGPRNATPGTCWPPMSGRHPSLEQWKQQATRRPMSSPPAATRMATPCSRSNSILMSYQRTTPRRPR